MRILSGRCHCGSVKFALRAPDGVQGLRRCNCSLCKRKGVVMATAKLTELSITEGEEKLSLYQWNTKIAKHYFCSHCGIHTHHQRRGPPDEYGFNVACIDGIELSEIGDVLMIDGSTMTLIENE